MRRPSRHILLWLCLFLTACGSIDKKIDRVSRAEWASVRTPSSGPTHIYGTYNKGCIGGAVAVPMIGPGFVLSNNSRGRNYGHPFMLLYLSQVGQELALRGDYMVVADIGQPRGGPLPGSHSSHQIGLDVDIWYSRPAGNAGSVGGPALPFSTSRLMDSNSRESLLISAAASQPEVERVFVNPKIKQALCERHADQPWMAKIRPWWGHEKHFHVRLACPPGERDCVTQPSVENDLGCGTPLDWWFSDEAQAGDAQAKAAANVRTLTQMPSECLDILHAP